MKQWPSDELCEPYIDEKTYSCFPSVTTHCLFPFLKLKAGLQIHPCQFYLEPIRVRTGHPRMPAKKVQIRDVICRFQGVLKYTVYVL